MKIDARRVDATLTSPGSIRAILLYGEDRGLIRARSEIATRSVAGSLDDPFRVAVLEREEQDRFVEEVTALPMTGGRRVVCVRDASDTITTALQDVLEDHLECLVVMEASGLPARSRLRALAERHAEVAAVACYQEEGRGLEATIRAALSARQVNVGREALGWLSQQLGADQALTRQEMEKLALYCGPGGTADLESAQACVGNGANVSMEDALFAATRGDVPATDRALGLAQAEGLTAVGLLRGLLSHLHKLHRARLAVMEGQAPTEAMRGVRPPVFFRRQGDFVAALELWSVGDLSAAMDAALKAERACKQTGAPDSILSAHALLTVARRASQMRRLSRG